MYRVMNKSHGDKAALKQLSPPEQLLPLIRQFSYQVSPVLARSGMTPNQVSLTGLFAGLASAVMFAQGTHTWGIFGALLWLICYLMDYCDGEVARITGKSSRYGALLDDIVDWIVHTSFFTALGFGALSITGNSIWLWMGLAAAAGTTLNAWLTWMREWRRRRRGEPPPRVPGETAMPDTLGEQFIYIFRGLFRADFWLLVIILELFHATWMLLPVFAVGVQVFWITGLLRGADSFGS